MKEAGLSQSPGLGFHTESSAYVHITGNEFGKVPSGLFIRAHILMNQTRDTGSEVSFKDSD